MAINLVQIIAQTFGNQIVGRIASALGINPTLAQTLLGAAIPTILATLGAKAATPGGAQSISNLISNQTSDASADMAAALGGSGESDFFARGSQMLSGLVGDSAAGNLGGILSKFTGAPEPAAQSVLELVTPAAIGALSQQEPDVWSSGQGIANLFASQKSAIASAMPAGLGTLLAGAGVAGLSNFAGNAAAMAGAAGRAATETVASGRAAVERAEASVSGGMPGWLKFGIPLVLAALAVWYMTRSTPAPTPPSPAAKPAATAPAPAAPAAPAATAPAAPAANVLQMADQLKSSFGALGTALSGITDAATAQAALPKLAGISADLEQAGASVAALPAEARKTVAGPLAALIGPLKDQLAKVMAIPGVGAILKPVIDPIAARLDGLAKG